MPIFAIPILILLAIFAISAGDDLIKNIDLPLPELHFFASQKGSEEEKVRTPSKTTIRQAPPADTLKEPGPQDQDPEYADWITIASVRQRDPYLITLHTRIPQGKTLTLTGWTIQGRQEAFVVPKGVELVPAGIQGAAFTPIVLKRGDIVKISGGANPFTQKMSFRVNQCFGYFKEDREFPVSVSSSCPRDKPKREDISHLSPACQDFILDFDRCRKPPPYPSTLSLVNDFQCRAFHENLEFKLSYEGCVRSHKADENFFGNEWHIYPNEEDRLIRSSHDTVRILDPNGLIVDEKVY